MECNSVPFLRIRGFLATYFMKKIISVVLAVTMFISMLPTMSTFAENSFDAIVDVSLNQHNYDTVIDEILVEGDERYMQVKGKILNSALIVDYGDDSYMIIDDGVVVLRNWHENTLTGIGISNATSLAIDGDILLISVCDNDSTKLFAYSIPTKTISLQVEINQIVKNFSMANNVLYYEHDANLYSVELDTGTIKDIYKQNDVESFYLYEEDIIAFNPTSSLYNAFDENNCDDNCDIHEHNIDFEYDPYKLLFIHTGEITSREEYESSSVKLLSWGTYDAGYSTTIAGKKVPFSDYPHASYYTDNGKACNHNTCNGKHKYVSESECNCKQWYNGVNMLSIQCFGFARHVYYRLFGYIDTGSQTTKVVSNVSAGNISVNYLKSIFGSSVRPGAHIRGSGHSFVYIGHDNNNIYTYDGNVGGHCRVSVIRRTWAQMESYFKSTKPGIDYISMPKNYPGVVVTPTAETPSITSTSYVGGKTVKIAGQPGSKLRYTRNGGAQQSTSGDTATFNITASETISAYAVQSGYNNSATNTQTISVGTLAAPTINTAFDTTGILVTMSAASGATIYYTTNGTNPTTSSTQYTGGFRRTTNTDIRAIAVQSGCAISGVAQKTITVTEPNTPSPALFETAPKIAVGDPIKVSWSKTADTSSYEVSLYRDSTLISTQETSETLASFVLEKAGQYQVKARAVNFVGKSAESPAVSVEAMNPCKVTFKDWDGTVIEEQSVKYNTAPGKYPNAPTREGHDPAGWSVAQGTKILQDTDITALYTIKTYNVSFYDVNGTTQLGTTQRIQYNQAATLPTNYNIATGYKFAGWNITQDSEGTSLEHVNGNIRAVATQTWENPNLPVVSSIEKAFREENGDTYKITVSFTNSNTQLLRGRLVTVLKTADGKMVASDTRDISAKLGVPGVKQTEVVTINYNGRVTSAETVVVGLDGTNTGGAYSEIISSGIVAETEWSEWSEWTTTLPPADSDQIESKTQYRARNYEYTSSEESSLSGWEKEPRTPNPSSVVSGWSSWSTTYPADKIGRAIESRSVPATHKTQWNYWGYKDSAGRTHFCAGAGRYVYGTTFNRIESGWIDYTLGSTSMNQTCSGGMLACWHSGRIYCYTRYNNGYYWVDSRSVQTGGGYTEYRYQDTTYTYYYRRFKAWSDWSDNQILGDQTENRTLYRYRNEVPLNDPNAGEEESEYQTYTTTGSLLGITEDFTGRKATVLVYEKINDDPTRPKLQYVGQTTIGTDNSYDFSFMPKGEPTVDTGDFIVTLALEGATRVISVDAVKAPKQQYTVTFISEGQTIAMRTVEEGEVAVPPSIPEREGHTFVGWSDHTVNIDSSRTLTALWQKNSYVAVMVDFANDTVEMLTYTYGDAIGMLKSPQCEGKVFKGWYTLVGEEKQALEATDIIKGNILIIADWEAVEYTVAFVDKEGEVVSTQQVAHGLAAQLPTPLTSTEMIFKGWSTDVEWWRVTKDMTVTPIFLFRDTTEAPMVSSDADSEGEYTDVVNIVTLTSSTEDTTIYYSIEGEVANQVSLLADGDVILPTDLDLIYSPDTPIAIKGDVKITMMAVADGMNASEIITVEVPFVNLSDGIIEDSVKHWMTTSDKTGVPSGYIDLPVYISNTEGIASCQLGLNYNTNVLTLISSTPGNAFQTGVENGTLTTLRFQIATSAVYGDYQVIITPNARDSSGEAIPIDTITGFVTIMSVGSMESGLYVNGTRDSKLSAGSVMVVKEVSATAASPIAIMAVYKNSEELVRTIINDNSVLNDSGTKTVTASTSMTQAELDAGYYIKFFVWNGLGIMEPIDGASVYTK